MFVITCVLWDYKLLPKVTFERERQWFRKGKNSMGKKEYL